MLHRDKRIGKSLYRITKELTGYKILEIYNDSKEFCTRKSMNTYDTTDEALQQLALIDRERYYTDPTKLSFLGGRFI